VFCIKLISRRMLSVKFFSSHLLIFCEMHVRNFQILCLYISYNNIIFNLENVERKFRAKISFI